MEDSNKGNYPMNQSTECNIRCEYGESEMDISSLEFIPTWVKKKSIRRVIGVTGGEWKDRIHHKPIYPRKCEVCGNTLKTRNTYFNHVVSKHKVTGVWL